MNRLAQRHAAGRMHRDDGITGALKIGGHPVARPLRLAAQAHHRNAPGAPDQLGQPARSGGTGPDRAVMLRVPLTARPTRTIPLRRAISTARVDGTEGVAT